MKRVLMTITMLVVAAMVADVTGTWSGSFTVSGGDHSIPQIVILKQNGDKLTGSAGPDAQEQYPLENGKVEGDRVTFELTSGEWKFSYDLRRTGQNGLKGNLKLSSVNEGRNAVVSLSRTK
jgi:hypothetical protein